MFQFVPDIQRLAQIFAQATAPTFFLGAVAAFVSLMSSRLGAAIDRIRVLNAIAEDDTNRSYLKEELRRLRRRAVLLSSGIRAALIAGIFATILLALLFITEFGGFRYAYGAGLLFLAATLLLGFALFRFVQEARISLSEADEFE
jgi:Protein of unknown function (DUF2721)